MQHQAPHSQWAGPEAQVQPADARAWSWSGIAQQSKRMTVREWLGFAGAVVVVSLLAYFIGFWVDGWRAAVLVVGYGVLATRAIAFASRVGPPKPFALDPQGLWFDGVLLFPRPTIQYFKLLMVHQAASVEGVSTRAFAGGIQVVATAGSTWFELPVPHELAQLARGLGIRVFDPPTAARSK